MSQKMFDYRLLSRTAKNPIFSTISFAAIFFLIYADSIVSNLSITNSFDLKSNEIIDPHETQKNQETALEFETTFNSTVPSIPTQEKVVEEEDSETQDPLIPPDNVSKDERLMWFRRKLPELEILQSNNLSQKFHGRVLEFLNHGCTVQFYMTWFSTAQSFGKREFLAADTLFKVHPQGCLMIISNTMDTRRGYRILKPIIDRGFKILAITPDLPFLVKNTPAEAWFEELKGGRKDPGNIPLFNNLSNLIRLAMLYKYGGIYLDTDFIILKDFSGLRNSIGAQSMDPATNTWNRLNAITPDLPFLVKNTPAEAWFEELKGGRKDPGNIPLFNNLSNLIRLAMLYKYGGIYLDTDFIILKDFSGLRNSIGAQSMDPATNTWNRLNGAVMIFDINHPLLIDFMQEFATTFNGNKWGFNGPYLVSRVIERVGNTPGYNITILPPKAFYAADWFKINGFLKKPENEVDSQWVERKLAELNNGETYAIHLWNKRSRELKIEEGSVMARLILDHCVICEHIYDS
ncbi:lactosylceramide 4-alpha-galactosyltransferase [Quercus suber]|uniref:Lactosylceramide 4-alpha-galactosyltransferase n=1 Tax=Quercus suber TaxID=58331 RepID=A0AAW0KQS8_QUESU